VNAPNAGDTVEAVAADTLTPARIRALLAEHGIDPRRSLGQHFLVDPNTARRIVRLAEVTPEDHVLEIGPGAGSLTVALAASAADVLALEIDGRLVPVVRSAVGDAANVRVEHGDALAVDYRSMLGDRPWLVVSNLPYNVATPIVVRLLEDAPMVRRMLVMVQREVAERLAASPGTRACGSVSVTVAWHAHARLAGTVPPAVFFPRPKVESALLELRRRDEPPVRVSDPQVMFDLVRAGFAQRRKTLGRALRTVFGREAPATLRAAGIDPATRAERLELGQWAALSDVAAA